MSTALAWTGGLGGLVVFTTGVWAVVRGIFRQADATKDNTKAVNALTKELTKLTGRVDDHGQRIARLEGRRR